MSVGILAVGCGDDGDDGAGVPTDETAGTDDANGTETTPGEETVAPDADPVRVVYQPATESLSALPVLRAIQAGYFDEEGIELDTLPVNSASAQVSASVDSGQADFATSGATGPLAALAGGQNIAVVAATAGFNLGFSCHNDTVARLEAELGVTPESSYDEKIEALRGLTLGLPAAGSTTDIGIRTMLSRAGVDPDSDLTIQGLADPAAMVAAAREHRVDCYAFSPPTGLLGVSEGWAQAWIMIGNAPTDYDGFAGSPGLVFLTSRDYIAENPEVVNAAVRALQRATDDVTSGDPLVSEEVKEQWFPELDQDVWELSFDRAVADLEVAGLMLTEAGYENLLELFNADRDDPVDFTIEEFFDFGPLESIGS